MELYIALHTIFNRYGKGLLAEERLINFLSDFHAFDVKATHRVMQTLLQMEYGQQILELDAKNSPDRMLKISNISLRLIQEGFQKRHVEYVLDSICYGLGWQGEIPEEIDEEEAELSVDKHYVTVNGISFAMVSVMGGTFDMGATPEQGMYASFDEKPSIQVSVSGFFMAESPVFQGLWTAIMNDNPSHFKGKNFPVERVSWDDCQEFIKRLSIQTGIRFRLPTEAEWEYAARGGCLSKHCKYSGSNDSDKSDYIWFKENSLSRSQEVMTKRPNELGLYDMSGNIAEWCADWYFNSYANNGDRKNPKGPASGIAKVYRGGSWDDKAMNCRVSKRFNMNPIFKNKLVGLRLAATNI